jgi:hypothetical protein
MRSVVDVISFTHRIPVSKEHKVPRSEFLKCWDVFVNMLVNSTHIKQAVEKEKMRFPDVIL